MDEVTCLKKRRWRMDKLSLKNKDWKDFYLSDFFDFEKGNQNNMASLTTGTLPLVSAKKTDNGYKGFVSKEQKKIFRGDILTLNNDGDGGAGIAYYQPTSMALDSHVSALIPKSDLNKYHLLFVSMCITKQRERFGHGYSINGNRLRAFKIMLPLAADCTNPDWQFMEEYMRRKETLLLKPAVEKLCKRLIHKEILGGVKWKAFFLEEIAQISSGKDIYERERTSGQTPYVTATANNNGIGYFVGNQNETLEKGSLSVNRNGSVGYCFYHPYDALYGNDTRKLKPIRNNKYVSLFISMCITNQRAKYGYGYKMGTGRLKRQKILLPIDGNSQPNWDYMEAYMQNLEQQQILEYLRHIER